VGRFREGSPEMRMHLDEKPAPGKELVGEAQRFRDRLIPNA
jgi:hypothetical protein